jgi:hypothetical protein
MEKRERKIEEEKLKVEFVKEWSYIRVNVL